MSDRYAREGMRVKLQRIAGLTDKGVMDEPYYFQCPPLDEFTVEHSHEHNDYMTVPAGQFSRRAGVRLKTITLQTLVVDTWVRDPHTNTPGPGFVTLREQLDIEALRDDLIDICEQGTPFLLTVAHALPSGPIDDWSLSVIGPEAQWPATLRRLRVTEKAGEGDARYFDMDFVEYRDPVVARAKRGKRRRDTAIARFPVVVEVLKSGGVREVSGGFPGSPKLALAVSVESGKTLMTLAGLSSAYYGDPAGWRLIARENDIKNWGQNGNLLDHPKVKVGTKLRIPAPPLVGTIGGVTAGIGSG